MSVERRTRADGRPCWVCRYRQGGKQRARTFDRRQDALAHDAEVRRRRQLGEMWVDTSRTVAELHDEWLATHGRDLAPKTLDVMKGAWRVHVRDQLGGYRLNEVTPLVLERWARERIDRGGGEAAVEKAWLLLSSMFGRAAAWEWVARNPVRLARRPRKRNAKRQPIVLLPEQVERIRGNLGPRDATLVSVLAYAGLRPGEALALTWADVGPVLNVSKALSMGQAKGTKTGRSRRVPLAPWLAQDLREWRMASKWSTDRDLIFPNFRGDHWTEADTRAWAGRYFKPALRKADLDAAVRVYDLRHSAASMWIASCLNVVEVARRMGHSPTMCLDTYAHVFEDWDGEGPIDLEAEVRKARSAAGARPVAGLVASAP